MGHHVLLLGGHGKVAQLLTPLLLRRAWDVTSVIRSPEQAPALRRLAEQAASGPGGGGGAGNGVGKLTVLVRSLEEVKSEADAKKVLDEVGPDYVVWSAGESPQGFSDTGRKVVRQEAELVCVGIWRERRWG